MVQIQYRYGFLVTYMVFWLLQIWFLVDMVFWLYGLVFWFFGTDMVFWLLQS